ncbi:MAG: chemotaxis protein [Hoeflea sp.]|uniref:chemotaxis protein n=1 Tax=Hoeflea sp. TaxID=1940281 RepID=UPI001D3FD6A0|nr:chemotaxis protein [Hoeflea sp.]MBU4528965.1 chemotaxis protein [Alphaproteobacteria bacterium]MBU4544098.1 chemotaxis protein [Alphaproteobacteria bacterium]MBU4551967.1 chemotaxis protein [Alphaproteobacteria bacterium]MBV1723432.1 chemotaxis protein [Hoeflea sp.]MBV1760411.1 chemotaxis protein [Hoeflea sp.]
MPRTLRPGLLSCAVLAAVFAFGASAQEQPAAPGSATLSASGADGQSVSDGNAGETSAGSDGEADEAQVLSPRTGGDLAEFAMAGDMEALEPYKLVRSLQFVQDAVVNGDHSAMEMQRFLVGVIESRLRSADQQVFDDPRNVDAALIYAMSGGNPETLDLLAVKDKFGNFDNEVITVLRAYLNGRAAKTKTSLAEVVEIYKDSEIGPYLTLVAANVLAATNEPADALELFDWARLTAPGTLVEEAALRRSLFVAARKNLVDEALHYAQLYARRFINSPYAGQYADLLVDLVVLNYGKVGDDRLSEILSFMDRPRKREVYLRIARKAVISGLRDLAVFASGKAEELAGPADKAPQALADLYSGMASIPTDGVDGVLAGLNAVPELQLSGRDRALRAAAQIIATEVLRKPDPNSLTQAFSPNVNTSGVGDGTGSRPSAKGENVSARNSDTMAGASEIDEETAAADEVFQGFVSDRKQTLERIDKLLEGVEEDSGS